MIKKFLLNIAIVSTIVIFGSTVQAGLLDLVSKEEKAKVQDAMKTYVAQHAADNGKLAVIHNRKIVQLTIRKSDKYPDGFHSGVKQNGNFYTSCADFSAGGSNYDVDFLVRKVNNNYVVVQPIVHKINGIKNPYDISH
tara:strand:- start:750 stop:1163 length:414 start_codon:yes stop_codon:yes gene_type:complete